MENCNTNHNCCPLEAAGNPEAAQHNRDERRWNIRYIAIAASLLVAWVLAWHFIKPLARGVTLDVLGLAPQSHLAEALEFFLYDTVKIFLLLCLMVYAVGWLRANLQTERIRDFLAGRGRFFGYLLGSGFGAVTPFCSCSSIPLFLGFSMARIPVGVTMAFLITSPIINEVAIVLLWELLGWKLTLVYVATGIFAGILGGVLMDAIHAERWLQPFLRETLEKSGNIPAIRPLSGGVRQRPGLRARHAIAFSETRDILRRTWPWIIAGVAVGAALHGYIPQSWFEENLGQGQWWSVPLAVMAGIPLYANVTGIIPVMQSLLAKGLPVGTTLAFCMGTVAASLPEVLMLRQVMKARLLAVFLLYLFAVFTLTGWLLNFCGFLLL